MASPTDPDQTRCQIARTLEIVGEKWSLLIVRNALRGQTRFSEFRASLGVPTDILSARLATLVAAGILEKRSYRETGSRERSSYHLTPSGEGLRLVMASMIQWGDRYNPSPFGAASLIVDPESMSPVELSFVSAGGERLDEVAIVPGPASTLRW